MKIIILCAGSSSRTKLGYPKCLYKFQDGERLIEKNIRLIKKLDVKNKDIFFATGFKSNEVKKKTKYKFNYVKNIKYKTTNMIYSLNKVLQNLANDDILILYSDILFEIACLKKIYKSKSKISTLVDLDWKKKWKIKTNYKDDLEELILKKSRIVSMGKKVYSSRNIDGRFIGITKFSKKFINEIKRNRFIDNVLFKDNRIDFTNFLNLLINNSYNIKAITGKFKWNEFDTFDDFKSYEKLKNK
tara:strand:+ start:244 stop:975 length:732 start_codon:yes stop_codon:yes gene_type:complete